MPSETDEEVETPVLPDAMQVDVQKVVNSFSRQVAAQASSIAMLEAQVETLQEEGRRKDLEIAGLKAILQDKPAHNGRVTTPPKSKAKGKKK